LNDRNGIGFVATTVPKVYSRNMGQLVTHGDPFARNLIPVIKPQMTRKYTKLF